MSSSNRSGFHRPTVQLPVSSSVDVNPPKQELYQSADSKTPPGFALGDFALLGNIEYLCP
jgi:hypothetical protein